MITMRSLFLICLMTGGMQCLSAEKLPELSELIKPDKCKLVDNADDLTNTVLTVVRERLALDADSPWPVRLVVETAGKNDAGHVVYRAHVERRAHLVVDEPIGKGRFPFVCWSASEDKVKKTLEGHLASPEVQTVQELKAALGDPQKFGSIQVLGLPPGFELLTTLNDVLGIGLEMEPPLLVAKQGPDGHFFELTIRSESVYAEFDLSANPPLLLSVKAVKPRP
jgi:hypothetical protein